MNASRANLIFTVALLVVTGLVGLALVAARTPPVSLTIIPPPPTQTPAPSATRSPITVYVTGQVANADTLVQVPFGSRIQAVVDAAGGPLANADLSRVNLADTARDGDQVHVPAVGETPALPTRTGGDIVFVNSATLEELDTLPGIGPALAQAILEYRQANGPFTSLEDLDAVEGIGPALLADLESLISFD